jgi:opacity protein-like surface antigen
MRLLAVVIMLLMSLSNPPSLTGAEFGDIDLSIYVLGSWPRDQGLYNQGTTVDASLKQGIGAGVKVGLFPQLTKKILGLELDSFGHGGALSFSNNPSGHYNGTGRSDILLLNTMFNLVLRYPGEVVIPYVGIGAGWSHGILLNPNIQGRDDKDFDSARAFGHQYLAGMQAMVSPKVFVFGEYRYFSANYHWEGLAVDFRSHYGLFGIGLRF